MLKRYQILLNDWLAEYIRFTGEKFDWSFSETIRLTMCVQILSWASTLYPKQFKPEFTSKELAKKLKKYMASPASLEESFHSEISRIYFEARKAVEFIIEQENNHKKNK